MSPAPVLEETRKEQHRALELRVRQELVGGKDASNPQNLMALNPENARQGLNKVLGLASACSGVPYALVETIQVVDEGPALALGYPDESAIFQAQISEPGEQFLARLGLYAKLLPDRLFGTEQAIQYISLASVPMYDTLFAKATAALNDPTGYQHFAWILTRLVQERVPLTDGKRVNDANKPRTPDTVVTAILEGIAAGRGTDEASLGATVERIRAAIKEVSARYYTDYYHLEDRFDAGSALLDALADPARESVVEDSICHYASERNALFAIVVSRAGSRRALRNLTEGLFEAGRLNRPAVVLSQAELPTQTPFPASKGEIVPVA